ncbi:FeoB-associated Cys-rich membrane protein [Enterococcus gallinarum]|nr:FeoB-associated Cys-rich membrane protein [Enterococcus gallinarum]MCC4045667.1 FeoB-associated Cys-rich membrane protein [Enterococcus gallinarum]
MIATILLSLVIFGYAGKVLYRIVKKGSCSDCHQSCPVKHEEKI